MKIILAVGIVVAQCLAAARVFGPHWLALEAIIYLGIAALPESRSGS